MPWRWSEPGTERAARRDPELRGAARARRAGPDRLERADVVPGGALGARDQRPRGPVRDDLLPRPGNPDLDAHADLRLPEADRHGEDVRPRLHEHRDPRAEGHGHRVPD